jgi:hypothetical protein
MSDTKTPELDRPGAGLPKLELVVARLLFGWTRWTGTPDGFRRRFLAERETVRQLVERCPPARRGERVLIERVRGLEDSSRFWSVWMTLDHLRIVHVSLTRILGALSAGQVPPGAASTAAVKPSTAVGSEVEAQYETSCEQVLAAMERAGEGRTRVRFDHPWFGPLEARGWCALAGTHLRVHRVQMERLLEQLRRE